MLCLCHMSFQILSALIYTSADCATMFVHRVGVHYFTWWESWLPPEFPYHIAATISFEEVFPAPLRFRISDVFHKEPPCLDVAKDINNLLNFKHLISGRVVVHAWFSVLMHSCDCLKSSIAEVTLVFEFDLHCNCFFCSDRCCCSPAHMLWEGFIHVNIHISFPSWSVSQHCQSARHIVYSRFNQRRVVRIPQDPYS